MPTSRLDAEQLDAAEAALEYRFKNRELLELALIHQSYVNEHPDEGSSSNERLEFLGDSILGAVVAERLYSAAPDLPEGDLTVRKSQVVRGETLAATSRSIGLGEWLVMGNGEALAGGAERSSNLADAFEAAVGAVYVDRGYRQAQIFVDRWLGKNIDDALNAGTRKDPKSLLQEYLQANGKKPPRYRVVSESGPSNDIVFKMEVVIGGDPVATGSASRKLDAERKAATRALEILRSSGDKYS